MGFFKNIFHKENEPQQIFSEGDIFYTVYNKQYHLYKLLKADTAFDTYHVLTYKPLDQLPDKNKINELEIFAYHSPIAISGFEKPKLFAQTELADDDFSGYREYLKQTQNFDELIPLANKYYREAYALTDLKQHEAAIEKYSKAVDLFPQFYEAIDNRAFCKMDLARWNDAIEDFKLSLTVNPVSILAEFSIGECYLKMKKYKEAIMQFEKALVIDPNDKLSKEFLKKAKDLSAT